MKTCQRCKEALPESAFGVRRSTKDGLARMCKKCDAARVAAWRALNPEKDKAIKADWRSRNKDRIREYDRRKNLKKYGLTPEKFERMWLLQDGRCAACGRIFPLVKDSVVQGQKRTDANVDHDHATGAVRELLCTPCNAALGQVNDNAEHLRALIAYLEKHS